MADTQPPQINFHHRYLYTQNSSISSWSNYYMYMIFIFLRWCIYINYIINKVLHTTYAFITYVIKSDYMFRHFCVIFRSLYTVCVVLNRNKPM